MSAPKWTRSSRCSGGTCVEAAFEDGQVIVRDSKNPDQQPLAFTFDEWREFIAGVENGEYDLPNGTDG